MMKQLCLLAISILITGCQAFTSDEVNQQLEQEIIAYATESAMLRDQIQIDRTQVIATVQSASTQSAQFSAYNNLLVATLRAINPPTPTSPPLDVVEGPLPFTIYDLSSGEMRFVQLGTASQIDSSGCFVRHQNFFNPMQVNTIYMTGVALNLRAGTTIRVNWQYEGEIVYSNSWVAPQSIDGQCFAIPIQPSNAPFLSGNWTATVIIDGEPIDPAPFTISGG